MDQTKDADAAVAAGVADETPAPAVAPAAATVTTTTETETETKPTENPVETSQPVAKAEDDESDWEELDEVLDDFSKPKPTPAAQQQQPSETSPEQPQKETPANSNNNNNNEEEPDLNEDDMLKQLEAGMAELMKGGGPAGEAPAAGDETWNALTEELSKSGMQPGDLMKLMMGEEFGGVGAADVGGTDKTAGADAGAGASSSAAAAAAAPGSEAVPENFQETIRKTMERMQESGEKATAAANEGGDDDMLMQVLKAMEAGGAGEGDDENLDKVFMGIMEQLSNKEMLYEPMKELHDKFGPWMKENREKVSKEDLERYEGQATLVSEIVAKFDEKGYNDDNPAHKSYVWERMQKMQAAGSPPDDLVSNPFGDDKGMAQALGGGDMPACPQQ